MTAPSVPAALDPEVLYMGDGGRIHCGAIRCAGHTAHATGHGLYGEPVVPVTRAEALAWLAVFPGAPMACETCGREATSTAGPTGAVLTRSGGDDEDRDVDVCPECGHLVPLRGDSLVNRHHEDTCSLHGVGK